MGLSNVSPKVLLYLYIINRLNITIFRIKVRGKKKSNVQLLICLAYNNTKHYMSPVFFALMQTKNEASYKKLHENIRLFRKFEPDIITVDFEKAHLNVIMYSSVFKKILIYIDYYI